METFKLPVGDFEWIEKDKLKTWTAKDIMKLSSQSETGYAFEVDLQYPNSLHKVIIKFFIFLFDNNF